MKSVTMRYRYGLDYPCDIYIIKSETMSCLISPENNVIVQFIKQIIQNNQVNQVKLTHHCTALQYFFFCPF